MKTVFILFCSLYTLVLAAANALPVIYNDEMEQKIAPAETGKMQEIPSPGTRNDSDTPRGTFAGRLAVNDRIFQWTPSQIRGKVTGGADLIDAILSPDESMLLLAERLGGSNAPNSTRLIMVNLRNGKVCRSIKLAEERITKILFIPGSDRLIAIRSAQPEFNKADALIVINLKSGRIIRHSKPQEDAITSLASDGEKVWFTVKNQPEFRELSLDDLKADPVKIRTKTRDAKVAITQNQSNLIVYGNDFLEQFRVSSEQKPTLEKSISIPGNFLPSAVEMLSQDGSILLLSEPGKKAVLFQNGEMQTLAEKTDGNTAVFSKEKIIVLGIHKNNALLKFTLPSTAPDGKAVIPGKLKPLCKNSTWKLLPLTGDGIQAILIDHRANIMRLEITKRRWKKHAVLTIDKTGLR